MFYRCIYFYLTGEIISPEFMQMYLMCAWGWEKSKEGVRYPGARVKDGCKLPHGVGD